MKKLKIIFLLLFVLNIGFSQNKKETEQRFLLLEEKNKNTEAKISNLETKITILENEITNLRSSLLNTNTTLGLVSKTNLDLEKLVTEQNKLIAKLIMQNDSLLIVFKVKKEADFVSEPKNEEDSIIFLFQSYFACKKWEDRLNYVLKPETVKEHLKNYYKDGYESAIVTKKDILIQGEHIKLKEVFRVIVADRANYYCIKTENGFKIDWDASVGYNATTLKTLKANNSFTPTELRIVASIYDYYPSESKYNANSYWAVKIIENEPWASERVYISKSSNDGKKLYEILKDGKEHQLILEIQKVVERISYGENELYIVTKFVREGWSKY